MRRRRYRSEPKCAPPARPQARPPPRGTGRAQPAAIGQQRGDLTPQACLVGLGDPVLLEAAPFSYPAPQPTAFSS